MPMFEAIGMFAVILLVAVVRAAFQPPLARQMRRPTFWLSLFAVSTALSAASGLAAATRHSGTGFTTSYGWPKPFYFRFLSESGDVTNGWSVIYFVGNSLVYAAVLLVLWTAWRSARR
jgi:hypothetical protein